MFPFPTILIDNPLNFPANHEFTAILGATPSRGARSPMLWNAAFKAHDMPVAMLPMDVKAHNLHSLLVALDAESSFLGGAVASPHKEIVAEWLGNRLTPESRRIGAVNCLFRSNGHLWGTNTDGEAALNSLEHGSDPLSEKRVLLIGIGGAGKAVAAYLVGRVKRLTLAGRHEQLTVEYGHRIGAETVPWHDLGTTLQYADVLVNCTSVGSSAANLSTESPLRADQISRLPSHATIFDIIYDPSVTALIKLARGYGLTAQNGEEMNLKQAILAFGHVFPRLADSAGTRNAMIAARK